MAQRTVRFVEAMLIDDNSQQQPIGPGWWGQTLNDISLLSVGDREVSYRETRYTAEARSPVRPATPYLYFGRLRERQDFPDSYLPSAGVSGPLMLTNPLEQLSEATYIVPFGTKNYAAMMNPQSGATRLPPLVSWLNHTCGYTTTGEHLDLVPVIDAELEEKLAAAAGASRVHVRLAPDQDVSSITGSAGEALRAAGQVAPDEGYVDLTLSFGHQRRGSQGAMAAMLALARQLYGRRVEAATASLQFDASGELRSEQHNLLLDRVSQKVSVTNDSGTPATEEQILTAIAGAVDTFGQRPRPDRPDRPDRRS